MTTDGVIPPGNVSKQFFIVILFQTRTPRIQQELHSSEGKSRLMNGIVSQGSENIAEFVRRNCGFTRCYKLSVVPRIEWSRVGCEFSSAPNDITGRGARRGLQHRQQTRVPRGLLKRPPPLRQTDACMLSFFKYLPLQPACRNVPTIYVLYLPEGRRNLSKLAVAVGPVRVPQYPRRDAEP